MEGKRKGIWNPKSYQRQEKKQGGGVVFVSLTLLGFIFCTDIFTDWTRITPSKFEWYKRKGRYSNTWSLHIRIPSAYANTHKPKHSFLADSLWSAHVSIRIFCLCFASPQVREQTIPMAISSWSGVLSVAMLSTTSLKSHLHTLPSPPISDEVTEPKAF